MSNLAKKSLLSSTVFQYSIIIDIMATGLYLQGSLSGPELLAAAMTGFTVYAAKEGVAKASEAYRDRGMG